MTIANALVRQSCRTVEYRFAAADVSGSRVPDLEQRLDAEVLTRSPQIEVVYIRLVANAIAEQIADLIPCMPAGVTASP